jgi:hypothetical protein
MSGNVEQQNLLAGFRVWDISEVYQGTVIDGVTLHVPNVNDMVVDWTNGFYKVTAVNSSNIPTLQSIDMSLLTETLQGITPINRLAPYQQMMRAFLNTTVTPFEMNIDTQMVLYSVAYIKVFLGVDTSPTGTVISQMYNGEGVFTSENVPTVAIDSTKPNIVQPVGFNSSMALSDGAVVTAIFYNVSGIVVGQQGFLVKNSNLIRGIGQNQVYITSVELVSTLLDPIDASIINAPANISISGVNFQAQLNYSDGSNSLIAVDSLKCKLFGLDEFNPTISGVLNELTLVYYLSPNESALTTTNQSLQFVAAPYKIRAVNSPIEFSFKVFISPKFNSSTNQYTNDYWFCSLDRTLCQKLVPGQYSVTMNLGGVINTAAGTSQEYVVAVNVPDIIPIGYAGFTFPQQVTTKYGIGTSVGWIIDYNNDSVDTYGNGVYGEYSTLGAEVFTISAAQSSLTNWLQLMWEPIHSIFDSTTVLAPPTPTHMQLEYQGGLSPMLHIAEYWNITLPKYFSAAWVPNSTLNIIWYYLETDGLTYGALGVSPVVMTNTLV